MARPNSTLHDIASSIESIHGRLANLTGLALDQAGSTSRKQVDRVLTLLQVMESSLEELVAVHDAAYSISRAAKAPAGSFKEGAAACLEALRRVEKIADPEIPHPGHEDDDYFEIQDQAVAEILRVAGTLPPYAAGAIKVLAEFVVGLYQCGQYNLNEWKPEALMTNEELIEHRKAINAACV